VKETLPVGADLMNKAGSRLPSPGSKFSTAHFKMASPHIPDGQEASFRETVYWMTQARLRNQRNYITALEKPAILFFLFS
jgi:hypothetical protein